MYGMPASSRNPWSVPSSPYGPWTTRKATSIASASERTAARAASRSSPSRRRARGPCVRRRATSSAGARGAEEPGQRRAVAEQRGRAVGQQPAPVAVDVDQVRLEPIAVDRPQDRLGRRDAHLVLGRAAAGEDADPQTRLMPVPLRPVADELDLVPELDAEPFRDRRAHVIAEGADVRPRGRRDR